MIFENSVVGKKTWEKIAVLFVLVFLLMYMTFAGPLREPFPALTISLSNFKFQLRKTEKSTRGRVH